MRPLIFDMLFHDDRMFVLELTPAETRDGMSSEPPKKVWAVVTRRNVPGYPPHRSDTFPTKAEAVWNSPSSPDKPSRCTGLKSAARILPD